MRVEPASAAVDLHLGGGTRRHANTVNRYVTDLVNHVYFGYEIAVKPVEAGKRYRVAIGPLTLRPESIHSDGPLLTPVPLPKYPQPQIINAGDTIALDLLVNPANGQKLVDYIQISAGPAVSEPWDFSLENVQFRLVDPSLSLNGEPVPGAQERKADLSGALPWFYVPGKGRFILSIAAHEGYDFQKAGRISDDVLIFKWGGDQYEWSTAGPVMGHDGEWNLYVLYDASYIPVSPGFRFGASGAVESLLPSAEFPTIKLSRNVLKVGETSVLELTGGIAPFKITFAPEHSAREMGLDEMRDYWLVQLKLADAASDATVIEAKAVKPFRGTLIVRDSGKHQLRMPMMVR
jgi:hypothetical protein